MPESSAKPFSGIFVSYRRDDSSGHAGRLYDKLVSHFGKNRIFMDIDTIEPGEDFVTVIENAVASCVILIAIIGRNWVSNTSEVPDRLNDPSDFVRVEIATALKREIRVIPVLVQRASMPKLQDLPEDLAKLTRRNAVELTDLRWQSDVDQLVSVIDNILAKRDQAMLHAAAVSETDTDRRRGEEEKRGEEAKQFGLGERAEAALARRRDEAAERAKETHRRVNPPSTLSVPVEPVVARRQWSQNESSASRLSNNPMPGLLSEVSTLSLADAELIAPREGRRRMVFVFTGFIGAAALTLAVVGAIILWPSLISTPNSGGSSQPSPVPTARPTEVESPRLAQSPLPITPAPTPGVTSNMTTTWTNQNGIQFVLIRPGSFMMGSATGKPDESPVHRVTISQPFYMGKYEVTQAQWEAVMDSNPSSFPQCGGKCPVEHVSWDDAQKFIDRLNSGSHAVTYRLPTEAEWEFACRAGTAGDYAVDIEEIGWYSKNSKARTHAVGGQRTNAWGLADMHGNVWEWCQDSYHETYVGAPTNGNAWVSDEQDYRVQRGGSWDNILTGLRSSNRGKNLPDFSNHSHGLRIVAIR